MNVVAWIVVIWSVFGIIETISNPVGDGFDFWTVVFAALVVYLAVSVIRQKTIKGKKEKR